MQANLAFSLKLVRSLAFPIFGARVIVLMGSGASKNNLKRAKATFRTNAVVESLRDGIPPSIRKGDVIVIISPSSSQDYQAANKMASQGIASGVVLVNGFSKVRFLLFLFSPLFPTHALILTATID